MKGKWNLLCGIIDKVPKESSEAEYREELESSLIEYCLGWEKNKDFFSQYPVQMGSTPRRADIVIKQNNDVVIVIEVKKSTAITGDKERDQKPLPANFGILIGKSLKFFYANLREDIAMQLIFEVDFKKDNETGIQFLELFNKSTFDVDKLHKFCKQKIKEKKEEEEIEKLLADGAKIIIDDFHNCLSEKYPDIAKRLKERIDITVRPKVNGTPVPPLPPPPPDPEEEEIAQVRRRVPRWFKNYIAFQAKEISEEPINGTILVCFLKLFKGNSVSKTELKNYCIENAQTIGEKFDKNFVQMYNFGKNNHGKVFEKRTKDEFRLWKPVEEFIIAEWNKHPELH